MQHLIRAVEELEVAIDRKDVTCSFSTICGQGKSCAEIQEAAVEIDRKEAEKLFVILKCSCSVVIISYFKYLDEWFLSATQAF